MALIKCKECGATISDKAEFCPHCGCPLHPATEENHAEGLETAEGVDNVAGCRTPYETNASENGNATAQSSVEETIRANREILEHEKPQPGDNYGEAEQDGGDNIPPKKNNPYKWLYIIGAILAVLLVAIIIILVTGNKEKPGSASDSDSVATDSQIVLSSNITEDSIPQPVEDEEQEPQTPEEKFAAASSDDNPDAVAGSYVFTDADGITFQLTVKADKTAVLVATNGQDDTKVYYSWYKLSTMPYVQLRCSDSAPGISFPGGSRTADRICFTLDNIFYSSSACEANDPNLQLPLIKH